MSLQQHLPGPRQGARRHLGPYRRQPRRLLARQTQGVRSQHPRHGGAVGVLKQVEHHLGGVGAEAVQGAVALQRVRCAPAHDVLEQGDGLAPVSQAQHVAHRRRGDQLAVVGLDDGLVEQALPVANRALGGASDQGEGLRLYARALRLADAGQVGGQNVGFDPAQVEALAARQDGHRHLADLGGGENELGVGRRLLQRLQQGVERRGRQHVHFVDDIDLVARLHRGVAHPVQQLAHLVHLGARSGVQLQHVPCAGPRRWRGSAARRWTGRCWAGGRWRSRSSTPGPAGARWWSCPPRARR